MTAEEIIEIIKEHHAKAEAELLKCGRGSCWGRALARRDLMAALGVDADVE